MQSHRRAVSAASGFLGLALVICAGTTQGWAQSVQQPAPEATLPSLPDGFVVTPMRPIQPLPRFEFEYRAPSSGTLEGPSAPSSQPPGGCRYEERKLELLV
jgi:hypothetical protein